MKENALLNLKNKQKSKGKEIIYTNIEMADYLQPINSKLTIEQKQQMFAVRNRMCLIPDNFPKSETKSRCLCSAIEDMSHIYNCKILNEGRNQSETYENICHGTLNQQLQIFFKFTQNMQKRETLNKETEPPCDPVRDPLVYSSVDIVMDEI